MQDYEWLDEAKKLAVGQRTRIYHGAERRRNLVIRNEPTRYVAYCHACHAFAQVQKEFAQPITYERPPRLYSKGYNVPLSEAPKEVVLFLHEKGVSASLLSKYNVQYNTKNRRIMFEFPTVVTGRFVGNHDVKWYHYNDGKQHSPWLHLQPENVHDTRAPILLFEDLLSCIKVHHYTGYHCIWCNGTSVPTPALVKILDLAPDKVFCMFDGDAAGALGFRHVRASVCPYGVDVVDCTKKYIGKDPKDLTAKEIRELKEWINTF